MSQFSIKASFDGTELVQGFQDVKTELNGLKTAGDNAGKSLGQMLQQKNSTSNYSRQLGQIKQQLTDLSVNYSRLSDAEKNSEFGVAMANKIEELKIKALELKGVMDDVNSSLSGKGGAIDMGPMDFGQQWSELQRNAEQTHAKFESVRKISSGVASGFAAIQGAAALLGGENENLEKTLVKVQGAMAVAQGIGGIWDLVEGIMQASLAYGLNTAASAANTTASVANTAAKAANTAANTTNTTAVAANTTANNANTTSLVATTAAGGKLSKCVGGIKSAFSGLTKFLAGAGGPIVAFVALAAAAIAVVGNMDKIKRSIQGLSATNQAAVDAAKLNTELTKLASQSAADKVTRVLELANAYNKLGDDLNAKQQFVTTYSGELETMGIKMTDVNDAEDVFKNGTQDYINAIMARAKADALREKAAEDYKKSLDKMAELEEEVARQKTLQSAGTPEKTFLENLGEAIIGASVFEGAPVDVTRDFNDDWTAEIAADNVKEAEDALDAYKKQVDADMQKLFNEAAKYDAEADAKLKASGTGKPKGGSGGSGGSTTPPPAKGSLKAAQAEAQRLQDLLNNMDVNSPKFEQTKQALKAAQAEVERIQLLMSDTDYSSESLEAAQREVRTLQEQLNKMDVNSPEFEATRQALKAAQDEVERINKAIKGQEFSSGSLEEAQQQVRELESKISKMDVNSPDFAATKQALDEAKKKVEEIQLLLGDGPKELTILEKYDQAASKVNDIVKQHEIGLIDTETAKKQINEINVELAALGLKPIQVQLEVKTDAVMDAYSEIRKKIDDTLQKYDIGAIGADQAQELINSFNAELEAIGLKPIQVNINTERAIQAIDGLAAHFEVLNTIGSAVSSINSVYEAFKNLPTAMDEAENGWERFMVGFETGMTVLNAITSIFSMINTLITTFNTIQAISTALKEKDAVASGAQAVADSTAAGATMTKAGANMAEAATGAGKSVSWLPIVGPILAIAAIGAIMGVMMGVMSKSKFATGGIVPGNRIGDMDLVRVNGGEMILNNRQQSNLFRMIDQNRLPASNLNPKTVNFRIQGDTLVGVIENYNKKKSRS